MIGRAKQAFPVKWFRRSGTEPEPERLETKELDFVSASCELTFYSQPSVQSIISLCHLDFYL